MTLGFFNSRRISSQLAAGHVAMGLQASCELRKELGGGNSNICYFHPDPWGNDPIFD